MGGNVVMPQSLPNEALGDAKGVNQARYHVEMTPESCSAVHPNMVPNAPNMLQNMARYTFHMQRPRNLLFGDLQQTVLLLLSNICLHCGEYSARSCKHRRRRGWWWVSKAAPQAPDSLDSRHPEVHEKMQRCWRASRVTRTFAAGNVN